MQGLTQLTQWSQSALKTLTPVKDHKTKSSHSPEMPATQQAGSNFCQMVIYLMVLFSSCRQAQNTQHSAEMGSSLLVLTQSVCVSVLHRLQLPVNTFLQAIAHGDTCGNVFIVFGPTPLLKLLVACCSFKRLHEHTKECSNARTGGSRVGRVHAAAAHKYAQHSKTNNLRSETAFLYHCTCSKSSLVKLAKSGR